MSDTVITKPWRAPAPSWRRNTPVGFVRPCEPTLVDRAPAGPGWLHEIKHDGFRVLARKQGERVKVWSRRGADFTERQVQTQASYLAYMDVFWVLTLLSLAAVPLAMSLRKVKLAGAAPATPLNGVAGAWRRSGRALPRLVRLRSPSN